MLDDAVVAVGEVAADRDRREKIRNAGTTTRYGRQAEHAAGRPGRG